MGGGKLKLGVTADLQSDPMKLGMEVKRGRFAIGVTGFFTKSNWDVERVEAYGSGTWWKVPCAAYPLTTV